ncbi:hypothetical protein [Streptomyces glomeratus]|uniref:Uncharacterized protein n=1 Tax=Streptomyces glomeratus TaxID=284452 RepID=A0ABP6LRB1_9ACTN|nr:hypothetical protein [Streptomyces glomeratus]MCF1511059.1 hypothetical protein [Streptomyces glomeratus]
MLHVISLIAVSVVVVFYAFLGVLALTTGRMIVPWQRGRVPRPRLWGSGALLLAAGFVVLRFSAAVIGATAFGILSTGGLVLMGSGAVLQFLGQRVGRVQV